MSWWTTQDVATLKREFPKGGAEAVWAALPSNSKRDLSAICTAARRYKVRYAGPPFDHRKKPSTPEIDKALRAGMPLPEASRTFGRTRSWILNRLGHLRVPYAAKPKRAWSPEEDRLLLGTQGKTANHALRVLARAGYERSVNAVIHRRDHLEIGNKREFDGYVSHKQLAEMIGLGAWDTVARWTNLRDDPLPERKTGWTRLVKETDFRDWVIRNPHRLELRKMPRTSYPWFVELLSGKAPEAPLDIISTDS